MRPAGARKRPAAERGFAPAGSKETGSTPRPAPQISSRESSRSSSRSIRRSTSSLISPAVAQLDHGRALGLEQVAHQALVGLRPVSVDPVAVDAAVELAAARARGEAPLAVGQAPRMRSTVSSSAHSSAESSSRRSSAASAVRSRASISCCSIASSLLQPRQLDERPEAESLQQQGREDDREGEEDDQHRARGRGRRHRLSSGSASAAASETAPRIPVQADDQRLPPGRAGLALAQPRADQHAAGRRAGRPRRGGRDHRAATRAPSRTRVVESNPPRPSTTVGNCSPTSTKSAELSRNETISQTACPWIRVVGVVRVEVSRPM